MKTTPNRIANTKNPFTTGNFIAVRYGSLLFVDS